MVSAFGFQLIRVRVEGSCRMSVGFWLVRAKGLRIPGFRFGFRSAPCAAVA